MISIRLTGIQAPPQTGPWRFDMYDPETGRCGPVTVPSSLGKFRGPIVMYAAQELLGHWQHHGTAVLFPKIHKPSKQKKLKRIRFFAPHSGDLPGEGPIETQIFLTYTMSATGEPAGIPAPKLPTKPQLKALIPPQIDERTSQCQGRYARYTFNTDWLGRYPLPSGASVVASANALKIDPEFLSLLREAFSGGGGDVQKMIQLACTMIPYAPDKNLSTVDGRLRTVDSLVDPWLYGVGDCEDMAWLSLALLKNLGEPPGTFVVSEHPDYPGSGHAFALMQDGRGLDGVFPQGPSSISERLVGILRGRLPKDLQASLRIRISDPRSVTANMIIAQGIREGTTVSYCNPQGEPGIPLGSLSTARIHLTPTPNLPFDVAAIRPKCDIPPQSSPRCTRKGHSASSKVILGELYVQGEPIDHMVELIAEERGLLWNRVTVRWNEALMASLYSLFM